MLQSMGSQRIGHDLATEQQQYFQIQDESSLIASTEQKSSFKDYLAFFGHIFDVHLKLKFSFTLINIIILAP